MSKRLLGVRGVAAIELSMSSHIAPGKERLEFERPWKNPSPMSVVTLPKSPVFVVGAFIGRVHSIAV
jgi:hypothetical protein